MSIMKKKWRETLFILLSTLMTLTVSSASVFALPREGTDNPPPPVEEESDYPSPELVLPSEQSVRSAWPGALWLNDPLPSGNKTRVIVVLKSITVFEDNESGNDEWRYKVKIGNHTWHLPRQDLYYTYKDNITYPYTHNFNTGLFNETFDLTNGNTLGIYFEVESREIDTLFDDVSKANGALGFVIPAEKIWYHIDTGGDAPVRFTFEISAVPGSTPSSF
ncbi:hypothetical protein [Cohnella cholangitidis]|uniref:Uncharacterized protein n=1 Tax=Cohnella cholangitidis TaxID=2598458 RepID=A0A7G5C6B7_9BACL|nr:hypothetical protein [Cohnella cholangitidis]QMV44751.1 hypothetical protein FPL14_28995 [Cohnella cholangitidis]